MGNITFELLHKVQDRAWEFLGDVNNTWSLKGLLSYFCSVLDFIVLEIISKLWILVIVRDLLRACLFGGYWIMFIELCKISKLVMHLNSCSMNLGSANKRQREWKREEMRLRREEKKGRYFKNKI